MKKMVIILGAAASMLAGCATMQQVDVATPVGPNPATVAPATGDGQLEVYSALSGRVAGIDQTWWQHSDYNIYTAHGRRLQHVSNAAGYYSSMPRLVTLRPGKYVIEARAKGTLQTRVPVVIKPGEITRVHLDGNWQPNAPAADVVTGPEGYAIGWRASQ